MNDFSVHQYGVDVYGRPVFMTAFMHDWLEHRYANVGFQPRIAQGAFMERLGGGAAQSSGAHDRAKCVDFITDNLTPEQLDAWIWECRTHGGAAYRRDESAKHGDMPPHCHVTLGADEPGSPMADALWSSYEGGGDGLAAGPGRPAGAPDYERRPNPLVLTPPEEDMTPDQLLDALESPRGQAALTKAVIRTRLEGQVDAPKGRYVGATLTACYNLLVRIAAKVGA